MTSVRKAFAEDFEKVYPLFMGFKEPRPDKETFRRLFVRRWNSSEEHFGYILEDEDRPVGFLGTLHSTRTINGRPEKFCNLSCWIVQEEYRSEGLSLLFNVLKEKDTTFTNFTGVKVAPILQRFGFRALDERAKILLPFPTPLASPHPRAIGKPRGILLDPDQIAPYLDSADRRILDDHRPYRYPHVLLLGKDNHSYLIVKKVIRKRLPVAEIHYLSHPEAFAQIGPALMPRLCLRLGVVGLLAGEHYLRGISFKTAAVTIPQRIPRLFRPTTVSAEEMDTLYSELQVLNL